jgi:hypothetical protein
MPTNAQASPPHCLSYTRKRPSLILAWTIFPNRIVCNCARIQRRLQIDGRSCWLVTVCAPTMSGPSHSGYVSVASLGECLHQAGPAFLRITRNDMLRFISSDRSLRRLPDIRAIVSCPREQCDLTVHQVPALRQDMGLPRSRSTLSDGTTRVTFGPYCSPILIDGDGYRWAHNPHVNAALAWCTPA